MACVAFYPSIFQGVIVINLCDPCHRLFYLFENKGVLFPPLELFDGQFDIFHFLFLVFFSKQRFKLIG